MRALLALFAALAWSADPAPKLQPDAELAALKSAANAEIGAVNSVLSTPVEPSHKSALRDAVDSVVREAASCADKTAALDSLLPAARAFAEVLLKGSRSFDARADAALAARDQAITKLSAARKKVAALKKRAEDETDPKKKKRLEKLAEEAEEAYAAAAAAVSSLEGSVVVVEPARQEGKTRVRRFQTSAAAYDPLSSEIAKLPPSMAEPAAALKDAVERLDGEAAARTRFNAALNPLLDPARNLYARANSAHDAFDRACNDYRKVVSLLKDFDEALESCRRKQEAAESALAALDAILEKAS